MKYWEVLLTITMCNIGWHFGQLITDRTAYEKSLAFEAEYRSKMEAADCKVINYTGSNSDIPVYTCPNFNRPVTAKMWVTNQVEQS